MFQVGCISKKWNGVLKEVLTTADRFSVDFPPDIGKAPPAGGGRREVAPSSANSAPCRRGKEFLVLAPLSSLPYPYASSYPALLSPPCSPAPSPGVEMKSLLLAATFLIDYLHFEADPGDEDDEDD